MTDGQLAEMTAIFWFRWLRLWRRACAQFDAVNGATREEARSRLAYLTRLAKAAAKRMRKEERKLQRAVNLYAKTPEVGETGFRMDRRQLTTVTIFVFLRFLLLAVTIWLVALYARASGVSTDLSTNWFMALAFGFPALMFSWALSCVSDACDSKAAKRRVALFYTVLGGLALFMWVALTAMIFGPTGASAAAQGGTAGLTLTLGSVAADPVQEVLPLIATVKLWLSAIFGWMGLGVALLLTHVAGDTLVGAACTIWSKLSFAAGRETEFQRSKEYAALRAELAEAEQEHRDVENETALMRRVLRDYRDGRRSTVRDALARLGRSDAHQ